MRNKKPLPAPLDPPHRPRLGTAEGLVVVVVVTWAVVLVVRGMSAAAALELLGGAGLLGVRLVRQARA
jgi:hypothetical protein